MTGPTSPESWSPSDPDDDPLAPSHGYPGGPQAPAFLDVDAARAQAAAEPLPLPEPLPRFDTPLRLALVLFLVALVAFVGGVSLASSRPPQPPQDCLAAITNDVPALAGATRPAARATSASGVVGAPHWSLDRADRTLGVVASTERTVIVGNWLEGRDVGTPAAVSSYALADGRLNWSAQLATTSAGAPDFQVDTTDSAIPKPTTAHLAFRTEGEYRVAGIDLAGGRLTSCITLGPSTGEGPVPTWSATAGQVYSVDQDGRFVAHGAGSTVAWSSTAGYTRAIAQLGHTLVVLRPLGNEPAALIGLDPATGARRWVARLGVASGAVTIDPSVTAPVGLTDAVMGDRALTVAYDPSSGASVDPNRPIEVLTVQTTGKTSSTWVTASGVALSGDASGIYAAVTGVGTESWLEVTPRGALTPVPEAQNLAVPAGLLRAPGQPAGTASGGRLAVAVATEETPDGSIEVFTSTGRIGRIVAALGSRPTVTPSMLIARTGATPDRAPITAWELDR